MVCFPKKTIFVYLLGFFLVFFLFTFAFADFYCNPGYPLPIVYDTGVTTYYDREVCLAGSALSVCGDPIPRSLPHIAVTYTNYGQTICGAWWNEVSESWQNIDCVYPPPEGGCWAVTPTVSSELESFFNSLPPCDSPPDDNTTQWPPPCPEPVYNGPNPCERGVVGDPVSIFNGNLYLGREDISFPTPHKAGFVLKRSYNSRTSEAYSLGSHWKHNYELSFRSSDATGVTYIDIEDEGGKGHYFYYSALYGGFKERYGGKSNLYIDGTGYTWMRSDGLDYHFENERLVWIRDEHGNLINLTYSPEGLLQTATDASTGRYMEFHYNGDGRVSHISGPSTGAVSDGVWAVFAYDADGNLNSVIYPDGSGFVYEYTNGLLSTRRDMAGHFISSWQYDLQNRVISTTDRVGTGVSIEYVNSEEVRVTDAYGVVRTYSLKFIGGRKKVSEVAGPGGCQSCSGASPVRYAYDDDLNITEKEYANGRVLKYEDFDLRGNPSTVIKNYGTSEERSLYYTYHPSLNERLSMKEASVLGQGDKETIWDYDDDYNSTPNEAPTSLIHRKVEKGYSMDATGVVVPYEYVTTYYYNSKGQTTKIDGPLPGESDAIIYSYEGTTGNLLSATFPATGSITYSNHDGAGNPGEITDANGIATYLTHDGRNRLISEEINGHASSRIYNTSGEMISSTDRAGRITSYSYDLGRLVEVTDPSGDSIQYDYDSQGNRTWLSMHDALGELTFKKQFDYQNPSQPGRLWKEINFDGSETVYSYDSMGNMISKTGPDGLSTTYSHDLSGRVTQTVQPGGVAATFSYDLHGNLQTVTDPMGLLTQYTYDDMGRIVETVSPDSGAQRFSYNESGGMVSKTDANGLFITYTYDASGRLLSGNHPDPSQDITYSYDQGVNGIGRLTGKSDPTGAYSYSYDALGHLTREEAQIEGIPYIIEYEYDPSGILTSIIYPGGRVITYGLDASGRTSSVSTEKEGVTETLADSIYHHPFGSLKTFIYGNGLSHTQSLDQVYRTTSIVTGSVQDVSYELNPSGQVTGIQDNLDPLRTQSFSYDNLKRLTSAQGIYGDITYSYDSNGNRLERNINGALETYEYEPGTNRLSEITGLNAMAFSYDAAGNTIQQGSKNMTYDQSGRLNEITDNSASLASYTYKDNGQRGRKETGSFVIIYHYDRSGNLILETDINGNILKEYVYLEGQLLSMITPGGGGGPVELVVDNTSAIITGDWISSISVSGYYGEDYLYHEANGAPPEGVIVDNTDPSVSVTGTWPVSTSVGGYYGSDYQQHSSGKGTNSFTWLPEIPEAGEYEVYARWTAHPDNASNAKYAITHASGNKKVNVNQRKNGGEWNLLGTYTFAAGQTAITLTDKANGNVIADAVKIVSVNAPPNTATWRPVITSSGIYEVYARWTSNQDRATDAKYVITHAEGNATVTVNQRKNGGQWNLLGSFNFTQGTSGSIMITDEANGYVVADAIRLVKSGGGQPSGSGVYYYHLDHLGTPQVMTDENGAVVWKADYRPFGEVNVTIGAVTNNFRFPGQYWDDESGLHYNWHRYYEPGIGRYLRPDPIGLEGGVNYYFYSKANPINWFDSNGLKAVCQITGNWTVVPHPTNIDVTFLGRTWDWGDGSWLPPKIRIGYLNFEASADIKFSIKCEKTCLCDKEDRNWSISDTIPIRHIPIDIPVYIKASHWTIEAIKFALAAEQAYKKAKEYFLFEAAQFASDPGKWCKLYDMLN